MCTACDEFETVLAPSRRLKLWEITSGSHCSILGPLVQPAGLRLLREPVMNLAEALLVAELLVRPSHIPSSDIADNLEIEPDYGDDFVTIH